MTILFIIGTVILVTDYRTEWTRYLVCMCLLGSLAALATYLEHYTRGLASIGWNYSGVLLDRLYWIYAFCIQFTEHYIVFFLVMYSISYSRLFERGMKRKLTIFFLSLLTVCFFILPIQTNYQKIQNMTFARYYQISSAFCIPCILFAMTILILAYIKEKNLATKKQRGINLIIAIPCCLSAIVNLFIIRSTGWQKGSAFNILVLFGVFVVFVFLAFKYGAIGIRLRLEKQNINSNLESIANGTSMFNHTLKNEVSKISLSTVNIKHLCKTSKPDITNILANIEILENSSMYLRKIISRLKDFSDEIKLNDTNMALKDLVHQALLNIKPYIDLKGIKIIENFDYDVHISCDQYHMVESLTNVFKNSCEAITSDGMIKIQAYGNSKVIHITITDNGSGIKKSYLSKVFEPFFSTKTHGSENFGLGLSYCYRVIQKHNFDMIIYSKENYGTMIDISIPHSRIIKFDDKLPERSV